MLFELDVLSASLLRNLEADDILSRLTPALRVVYELRLRESCSYRDIARMLDLPVGTVQSRLHRARERLRELLQDAAEHARTAA